MPNQESLITSVNSLVDKVYVLSVKTFSERIAHIENEMNKHNIQFQFIFAYDIPEMNIDTLERYFSDSSGLTMAQKSLVLKTIYAWQDAETNLYNKILIFEDDAILAKNFSSSLKSIINSANQLEASYLIFLGGYDCKVPEHYLLSDQTLIPLPIATAEAYITDAAAIKKRLEWLTKNKISLPADHLICQMDKELGIANYWSNRPIVEQGSISGAFTSRLDKQRLKHSRFFNISRYQWNKFRRHKLRRWLAKFRQKINLIFEKNINANS